jgi:hypothetical protein
MKLPQLLRRSLPLAIAASVALGASSVASAQEKFGGPIGLGITTDFSPFGNIPGLPGAVGNLLGSTDIGLRLWLGEQLVLEPQLGLGFATFGNDNSVFGLDLGFHVDYALTTGNLRPLIGGALAFGILTGNALRQGVNNSDTLLSLRFGPEFGVEYFFTELHRFSFDASLWLPFNLIFPGGNASTVFSFLTQGAIFGGFHYYF